MSNKSRATAGRDQAAATLGERQRKQEETAVAVAVTAVRAAAADGFFVIVDMFYTPLHSFTLVYILL